jgi:hypothetical protein
MNETENANVMDPPVLENDVPPVIKKKKPISLTDISNQLRSIRITLRRDRDVIRKKISGLKSSIVRIQNENISGMRRKEQETVIKTTEIVREQMRIEIQKSCGAILEAKKKADVAENPDGALAAINQLAVESLFLLDRRVRTNRGGKRVGLREALCNVESLTMGNMRSIKSEIYKKTGPEGALLAEALKALTGGEEE